MHKSLFIFYIIFWVFGRVYILSDTYIETKIYHSIGLHFDILCLITYIISTIPYQKIKQKLFWCYFLLYELCAISVFSYYQLSGDHILKESIWEHCHSIDDYISLQDFNIIEDLFIPLFVVYVAYQIYKRVSKFDKENSAELTSHDIFLVFQYPKNIVGLILCIFTPIKANSVCLYSQDNFYKFKKEKGYIEKIHKSKIDINNYFFVNTGIKYSQRRGKLEAIVGKQWKINKNCLNSFQSIIGPIKQYI